VRLRAESPHELAVLADSEEAADANARAWTRLTPLPSSFIKT
jgi:hypothetical protein